jgi:hypothetical protein
MIEQGTTAWKMERLGHITASRIADVLATVKTGEAKGREKYRWEIVTQRITNEITEGYTNEAMAWGTATEPQARVMYAIKNTTLVEQVGFVKHPTLQWVGASPDGLVDEDGLIEIKCPNTDTHLQTILGDKAPSKYVPQMQMQMWVTGREWCDFVSYDPRLPDDLSYFCKRVKRDNSFIAKMEVEVKQFLDEVANTLTVLKGIK